MTVLKEFSAILAQRSKFSIQNSEEILAQHQNSEGILGQHSKVPPVSAGECDWENPGEMFSH